MQLADVFPCHPLIASVSLPLFCVTFFYGGTLILLKGSYRADATGNEQYDPYVLNNRTTFWWMQCEEIEMSVYGSKGRSTRDTQKTINLLLSYVQSY